MLLKCNQKHSLCVDFLFILVYEPKVIRAQQKEDMNVIHRNICSQVQIDDETCDSLHV